MSREEDLIRATTRAIASTVREVPPLQLGSALDELDSPAGIPRRVPGDARRRHWRGWLVPVTAAAAVVALAVSLVIIKDLPNGSAVPKNLTSATGPGGVPRYYVALKHATTDAPSFLNRNDIVVGDSLTGKTIATFAPPARSSFATVTAAADDRTFVVLVVTSSTGSFDPPSKVAFTGTWYEVRLAPGTAHPARLFPLPIKPVTVPRQVADYSLGQLEDETLGSVLSGSGKELAVPVRTARGTAFGLTVKVFSLATGRLLHEWTTNDPSVTGESSLTWLDGDRKLALVSVRHDPEENEYAVREWPVAGPASGDLADVSRVVWSLQVGRGKKYVAPTTLQSCVDGVFAGVIVINPGGQAFSCTTTDEAGSNLKIGFHTFPLTASTTATTRGTLDAAVTLTKKQGAYSPQVVWASPSGGTLVGALRPSAGSPAAIAHGLRIGVISHGTFTPLRIPASLAASAVGDIAF